MCGPAGHGPSMTTCHARTHTTAYERAPMSKSAGLIPFKSMGTWGKRKERASRETAQRHGQQVFAGTSAALPHMANAATDLRRRLGSRLRHEGADLFEKCLGLARAVRRVDRLSPRRGLRCILIRGFEGAPSIPVEPHLQLIPRRLGQGLKVRRDNSSCAAQPTGRAHRIGGQKCARVPCA
eukprot:scaffold5171_cov126-Isochrysis_galbana.AAC.3